MAEPDIKRLPISEFRDRGYLHEVNRLLLHPLGLALEVNVFAEPVRRVELSERQIEFLTACLEGRFQFSPGEEAEVARLNSDTISALGRGVSYQAGDEALGGVWDCQDDPEGVVYGGDLLQPEKAERVCQELLERRDERKKHTGGWIVQPIPEGQVLSTTYTDPELRSQGGTVVEPGKFAGVELPEDESE